MNISRGLAEGSPSLADLEKSSGPSVSPKPDNKDKRDSTDTDTLNLSKRPRYESGSDGSPPEPGRRAETKDGNEERGSERKRRFTDASRNIGISMKENIENELGAEEQSSQKKQIIKVSEVKILVPNLAPSRPYSWKSVFPGFLTFTFY